jgi:hypothetical protein
VLGIVVKAAILKSCNKSQKIILNVTRIQLSEFSVVTTFEERGSPRVRHSKVTKEEKTLPTGIEPVIRFQVNRVTPAVAMTHYWMPVIRSQVNRVTPAVVMTHYWMLRKRKTPLINQLSSMDQAATAGLRTRASHRLTENP